MVRPRLAAARESRDSFGNVIHVGMKPGPHFSAPLAPLSTALHLLQCLLHADRRRFLCRPASCRQKEDPQKIQRARLRRPRPRTCLQVHSLARAAAAAAAAALLAGARPGRCCLGTRRLSLSLSLSLSRSGDRAQEILMQAPIYGGNILYNLLQKGSSKGTPDAQRSSSQTWRALELSKAIDYRRLALKNAIQKQREGERERGERRVWAAAPPPRDPGASGPQRERKACGGDVRLAVLRSPRCGAPALRALREGVPGAASCEQSKACRIRGKNFAGPVHDRRLHHAPEPRIGKWRELRSNYIYSI